MSSSYADGLSPYENKGVLGLEEVRRKKKRGKYSARWNLLLFSAFHLRDTSRKRVNDVWFVLSRSSGRMLFFFFFFFFRFSLPFCSHYPCLQRYDSVETLRLKCGLLAEWIQGARHVVVHTGAGISTAAGIPDFRWLSLADFSRLNFSLVPVLCPLPLRSNSPVSSPSAEDSIWHLYTGVWYTKNLEA